MMSSSNGTLFFNPEISPSMIYNYLEKVHFHSIFDPLSSTSGGTGYFKLQNVRVISNDHSLYTFVRGKALWENNRFTIPGEMMDMLSDSGAMASHDGSRFEGFGYPFLDDDKKNWLSKWYSVIDGVDDEYIQALMQCAVLSSIDYWITTHEFKVDAAFAPDELLKFYLNHVNRQVMHNHESNEMWLGDPMTLADKVNTDALFLNPPPLKGYAAFGLRERACECWLRGTPGFNLDNLAPSNSLGAVHDSVDDYIRVLIDFLNKAEHIQLWIIALSNRQPFTRLMLEEILSGRDRKIVVVDIELPKGSFSSKAVHTVILAGG